MPRSSQLYRDERAGGLGFAVETWESTNLKLANSERVAAPQVLSR